MTDTINEQISAFVDGELPDAERELLQKRLAGDGDLQSTWHRYHLIRDAMREDLPEFINTSTDINYTGSDATGLPDFAAPVSPGQRLLKPVAGLAIAASVATMAVVGVLQTGNQPSLSGPQQVALTPASTVSIPDNLRIVPRSSWQSAKPAVVAHLNGYLVDHSSYAGLGSAQGILPYSRVAGYDEPMPDEKLEKDAGKKDKTQP